MSIRTVSPDAWLPRTDSISNHLVQFYDASGFPDQSISDFLAAGLRAGDSAIIIATPDHSAAILAGLVTRDAALATLEQNGHLVVLDAQATLDRFMKGGQLDRALATLHLGGLIDQFVAAAPSGRGRAYGEMVALLGAQGNFAAALALERFWNELIRARPFRLYCAYPMQPFEGKGQNELFRHVCDEHDEIVPVLTWLDRPEAQGRWLAILQQQSLALQREILERKRAEAELSASREELRALAAHLQFAREEERAGLARDLHDELGQTLTVLNMSLARWTCQLAKTDGGASVPALLTEVQEMTELTADAFKHMRRILGELRSDVLDLLGLGPALASQVQEFQQRTGIETHFSSPLSSIVLEPARALALYRIVQESLTNAARHAQASRVQVMLREEAPDLVLEIHDNGKGLNQAEPLPAGHMGILGMRERALVLGGSLEIRGVAQQGTTVTVRVPLDALTAHPLQA